MENADSPLNRTQQVALNRWRLPVEDMHIHLPPTATLSELLETPARLMEFIKLVHPARICELRLGTRHYLVHLAANAGRGFRD